MSKHKKQHFVPKCYLKAWCDPGCPKKQTPYVWVFEKESKSGRRKSPDNIFHETDMYTVKDKGGKRDLKIEHGLSGLERDFSTTRIKKLDRRRDLDDKEKAIVTMFIAATHTRTKSQLSHIADQWRDMLQSMDRLADQAKTATEEERRYMAGISPTSKSQGALSLTHNQVRQIVDDPVGTTLLPAFAAEAELLAHLDMAILCTTCRPGFITSDRPCVWFDPEAYKRPPLFSAPALIHDTIEITLPVSPNQCILLNRQGITGYIDIPVEVVHEFNRMQRFHASEHYVVCENSSNDYWFYEFELPEDSWEKRQALRENPS